MVTTDEKEMVMAKTAEQALLDSVNSINQHGGERAIGGLIQLADVAQRMEITRLHDVLSRTFSAKYTAFGMRANPELYEHFRHEKARCSDDADAENADTSG